MSLPRLYILISLLVNFILTKEDVLTFNVHRGNFPTSLIINHREKEHNLRDLNNDSYNKNTTHLDSTVIYGNSSIMNYYYVDIYIGTPLKKQTLIIDTGSGNTGVPCKNICERCGKHLNSYYDPSSIINININIKLFLILASNTSRLIACNTNECSKNGGSCDNNNKCSYSWVIYNILIFLT